MDQVLLQQAIHINRKAKDVNMKKAMLIIVLIVVVCAIVSFLLIRSERKMSVSFEEIAITNISLSENTLIFSGRLLASAKSYKDYEYIIIGDSLYITVYGGLATKAKANGDFNIIFEDEDIKNVNRVYLKHGEQEIQIHPDK